MPATAPSSLPSGTPQRKRFALRGRSIRLDPRIEPVRGDIADIRLVERVFAPHYAVALPCRAKGRADIVQRADDAASVLSEILPGDTFEVLELSSRLAWGRCTADGTVGFVPRTCLGGDAIAEPAKPPMRADYVALAEALVGTPGKPGGRSPAGVNCSGLLFYALTAAGRPCPRFLDHQRALGSAIDDVAALARGDLIFFADHVAIVTDPDGAVHVGADLAPVERVALAAIVEGPFGPVTARRRLA